MTKADPNQAVKLGMLNEAVDAILEGMSKLVGGLESKMNARFDNVENTLQRVETELTFIRDEVNGLKADFSTNPSRLEFEKLKAKVEKGYPIN